VAIIPERPKKDLALRQVVISKSLKTGENLAEIKT
jgi:hypothetical protein